MEEYRILQNIFQSTHLLLVDAVNTRKDHSTRLDVAAIKGIDVQLYIRKLRVRKDINSVEIERMYNIFLENIRTEEQLEEVSISSLTSSHYKFLSYLPESEGGLFPVAVGLFHQNEAVRRATVELFQRLDSIKVCIYNKLILRASQAGSNLVSALNLFLGMAYQSTVQKHKLVSPPVK